MATVPLLQAIAEAFRDGTQASNNFVGGLTEIAKRFKTTQRTGVEFTRNLIYQFGGFRVVTGVVTSMQMLSKSIQAVKGVVGVAVPVFEYLNNTLGITEKLSAVAGAVGSVVNLEQMQAKGQRVGDFLAPAVEKLDEINEGINDLWEKSGINDVFRNLARLDLKGAFKSLSKGGVVTTMLRLLTIIYGVIGKILLKSVKGIFILITKTFAIFLPYMVYVLGIIIAAMVIVRLLYESAGVIFDTIAGVWEVLWPTLSTFFGHVGEFLGVFFSAIGGIFGFIFGDTSLEEMLFGIFDLIPAMLDFVISGALTLLIGGIGLLVSLVISFVASISKRVIGYFQDNFLQALLVTLVAIPLLVWGGAFYVAGVALLIYFGRWITNRFTSYFSGGFWNAVGDWFNGAVGDLIDAIGDWWDGIEFMANGGIAKGGMAVVGERGPELVNLPRGARVHSNAQSRRMVATAQGGTIIHNNITINARDTSDGELRRIAERIGNMVNNKINRTTSSRTMR